MRARNKAKQDISRWAAGFSPVYCKSGIAHGYDADNVIGRVDLQSDRSSGYRRKGAALLFVYCRLIAILGVKPTGFRRVIEYHRIYDYAFWPKPRCVIAASADVR